jgi:hypothetical protein
LIGEDAKRIGAGNQRRRMPLFSASWPPALPLKCRSLRRAAFLTAIFCVAAALAAQQREQAPRIALDVSSPASLPGAPEPEIANSDGQLELPNPTQAKPQPNAPAAASVHGVVVNRDGAVYEGAHVSLTMQQQRAGASRQTTTDSNGRFNFPDVSPGVFKLIVSVQGFSTQTLTATLHQGESYEANEFVLTMSDVTSQVEVSASPAEIAQAELHVEETQRVLGVIPNFYVSYVPHPSPLTAKQKFNLALRSTIDPVTFILTGFVAGVQQATNSLSGYGQGAQGYAKRYGAEYADGAIETLIGSAILPAWWKQDPRYFYQGTGSKRSRALHAIASSVMCTDDNGHRQVNYSGIVGGLAAGGISNLYYPASDRSSAGVTFANALYGTVGSAVGNLFQEFVVRKLTPKVPNYGATKP